MSPTGDRPTTLHRPLAAPSPVARTSRAPVRWWWPLQALGALTLVICGIAAVVPDGALGFGSPGWWAVTIVLHAPFAVILVFLIAGLVERVGYFARGHRPEVAGLLPPSAPRVCVQLPMFNEVEVAARAIAAAGALAWPRDLLEIQVLDDSTDPDARAIVDEAAARLRADGVDCVVLRRTIRTGYKAGALEAGRLQTSAEYLAILDADFTPNPDFLELVVPYFYDGAGNGLMDVAVVQARWSHLNRDESALTRAQSLWVDDHHVLQMSWRSAMWGFVNFTGTAGVWRADAITSAGGWRAASLVEDCELSFRALFTGHRTRFVKEIPVPAELPATHRAYLAQQKRWTQGWAQLQRLHAVTLVRRYPASLIRRLHLAYHMGISWQWPLWGAWMLLLPVLISEQLWFGARDPALGLAIYVAPVILWLMFATGAASAETGRIDGDRGSGALARGILRIFPYAALNTGTLPHQVVAFCEGLFGPMHSEFVRTPKTGSKGLRPTRASAAGSVPRARIKVAAMAEAFFVLYQLAWAAAFLAQDLIGPSVTAVAVASCVVFVATASRLEPRIAKDGVGHPLTIG